MPSMDQHHSDGVVKLLIVGDTGSGKTGGLASLVDAGYNLRIIDLEDKLEVLKNYVKDKSKLKSILYETLKDEYKIIGTSMTISKAASYQRAMNLLNNWPDAGPITGWGPKDVLVIDALSTLGRASLNMVLQANGFTGKPAEIQHWGIAMENIEKFLDNVTNSKLVPCHVVMLTHLTISESQGGAAIKGYPEALGNKLNPKVGRRFNNLIGLSALGSERAYRVKRDGLLQCKTSKPMKQDKYPIATGLADIFKELTA